MIKSKQPLDFQWPVQEPFLFCVHHYDRYPKGNGSFGPSSELLKGRSLGQDFTSQDGFRMYHGESVPGFPAHPHRGFETITIVRKGYVDHADSLGAAARYGEGDVQWLTAGAGIQHSEMFPLLHTDKENTLELFQIWLNLPKKSKMSPAHFKIFWSEKIPKISSDDNKVSVSVIAGEFNKVKALPPPPESWAADPNNETLILLVKMSAGGKVKIPGSRSDVNRTLYLFEGHNLTLNNESIQGRMSYALDSKTDLFLATEEPSEFLLLQSKPIGEPVFQYGPFVMNSREDIVQTMADYQKTEFGGWSWPQADMVHGDKIDRFAKNADGSEDKP